MENLSAACLMQMHYYIAYSIKTLNILILGILLNLSNQH